MVLWDILGAFLGGIPYGGNTSLPWSLTGEQVGRNKDKSHQEPQSEHSWHAVKLLQRHSWSGGQDFESKAAEGGWALTFRVRMLPREWGEEGLEETDLRAKGAC